MRAEPLVVLDVTDVLVTALEAVLHHLQSLHAVEDVGLVVLIPVQEPVLADAPVVREVVKELALVVLDAVLVVLAPVLAVALVVLDAVLVVRALARVIALVVLDAVLVVRALALVAVIPGAKDAVLVVRALVREVVIVAVKDVAQVVLVPVLAAHKLVVIYVTQAAVLQLKLQHIMQF